MSLHLLGIRHHGPGSARHVKAFLEKVQPDIILVEGPPEADGILNWVIHQEMQPPVAILAFAPEHLEQAAFYPFAEFSPEWQALTYGVYNNVPVRFFDLPLTHKFALQAEEIKKRQAAQGKNEAPEAIAVPAGEEAEAQELHRDPLSHLAAAAGYSDGERWWERLFEHRLNDEQVFEAVQEAMSALREALPEKNDRTEQLREAHMRRMIKKAQKENYRDIVVVCGAWHVPALSKEVPPKEDNELLKNLPRIKVETTWIPWTFDRLAFESGYGAGIHSPGWYAHVWRNTKDDGTLWMTNVAHLFRSKQMDTSTAHVIEAVRLAEALAALRGYSTAGLEEMNEAALAVLCGGDEILLQLIRRELIVGNVIGNVPGEVPKPPLQRDIEQLQKRLRLPALSEEKVYVLDLRETNDLARSVLLHRLLLLDIAWGQKQRAGGKGTFKEQWKLKWEPEFSIRIIERGSWGNTAEEAATNFVKLTAAETTELKVVVDLLERSLPAELGDTAELLMQRINNLAAATGDVLQLMESLPGLVNVSRYGNVRKTDTEMLLQIVKAMTARICISLPSACASIDDEAARDMLDLFAQLNNAVALLQDEEQTQQWTKTLELLSAASGTAPVLAGYSTRLLTDHHAIDAETLASRFSLALSKAAEPAGAASWLEGFLKGTGTILLLDQNLWNLVNGWVAQLEEELFVDLLPLLRRTFSEFTPAERRKIGEKAKGVLQQGAGAGDEAFDAGRAKRALPVVAELLGL